MMDVSKLSVRCESREPVKVRRCCGFSKMKGSLKEQNGQLLALRFDNADVEIESEGFESIGGKER